MKKSQNTFKNPFVRNKNNHSFVRILNSIFVANGILSFDLFHFGYTFNEKLLIIYANIRV
ncbi:MAG: hypothetical protein H7250_10170 [Flavobacterium sp.]|nr:hypothetical protein [Flavobacterium sp.]